MSGTKILPLAAAMAVLAGCATTATTNTAASRIDVDSYALLGDIAIAEQRREDAAGHYLNAALASDDPAIAERAARMAHELGLDALGQQAIARWRELDPENPRVDYLSGIFKLREGRIEAAVDDFSTLLASLSEAELGAGFALILEALNAEPSVGASAEIMRELNERFPGTPEGHYALAQLALRAGRFELALANAEAAIDLEPEWIEAQLLHARTLLLTGRSQEGLALAGALAEEHDDVAVRLEFAELLLSSGELERADALLSDILRANPGMPEAVRARAFLALTNEELQTAADQFEMLRGNPDYRDEAFYYLGRIAEMESEFLQATRSYARVTEGVRAVEAQVRTSLIMYLEMDDGEGALRHLREFGNANPRFKSEMLLAQARLLLEMERPEDGLALIAAAVGDDPAAAEPDLQNAHVQFYSTLATDALDRADLLAAEAWIDEGLTLYSGDPTLRYTQSVLLQEQGRVRRALNILEALVDESPDDPTFLNALGYLLTDRFDRHAEARRYIQRALAMSPESGAIMDSMGWVLYGLGEYELALDYLERAQRLLDVPEVQAHLIEVHWALGNRETAREMLGEALRDSPDDPFLLDVGERLLP
jgi:tetratricopeptide (TPR) repeat protein